MFCLFHATSRSKVLEFAADVHRTRRRTPRELQRGLNDFKTRRISGQIRCLLRGDDRQISIPTAVTIVIKLKMLLKILIVCDKTKIFEFTKLRVSNLEKTKGKTFLALVIDGQHQTNPGVNAGVDPRNASQCSFAAITWSR